MSDSSIIQQARDLLAKWRDGTTPGPWEDYGGYIAVPDYVVANGTGRDIPLIVATAGNPELLDAIDDLLLNAKWEARNAWVNRIAAAIIDADERMSA